MMQRRPEPRSSGRRDDTPILMLFDLPGVSAWSIIHPKSYFASYLGSKCQPTRTYRNASQDDQVGGALRLGDTLYSIPYIIYPSYHTSCPQVRKCLSLGSSVQAISSRPMRPRLVNMVELTGDLGMSCSPLTANMERTWAAAWFHVSGTFMSAVVQSNLPWR